MTTVKIKFRSSTIDGRTGTIFYQVTHNRIVRQQKTTYRLYAHEWDAHRSEVLTSHFDTARTHYLQEVNRKIKTDIRLFGKIITSLEQSNTPYTADDVIAKFTASLTECTFFTFMEKVIENLKALGKIRTSETYATTLNSFKRFRNNEDLSFDEINSDMMIEYENHLRNRGIIPNSTSFYMRILRAVYNRAIEKGLAPQHHPFRHVYTGVDKTMKRAIPLKVMKQIKEMDLSTNTALDFARDMFLFSFYTRGMSFIDMAYLRKKDLSNGILSYRRRKTGQQLFIKWEKCMKKIVDKYNMPKSKYLLPIIKPNSDTEERKQYIYSAHHINRNLKAIGSQLGLSIPLTMYVSRHAWASIAKSKNIPISIISEGMGHDSETTTRIYLASLETNAIDKANKLILKSL